MSGKVIGYRRVSSILQNTERQLDGLKMDKVFEDKLSGKDTNRPQLQAMLEYVREHDTVLVHSLDRLGRNIDDLRALVKDMVGRGVTVKFVKENLCFTSEENNHFSELMLNMLAAFAQFERSIIKERQKEGVQLAKAAGAYKGRKQEMTPERITEIASRVAAGEPKAQVAKALGISRDTLYRYLPD
ncbi:recombinase family protein [Geomonas subterranea]|uniref:Recombinase family protein n=1 Tax=Geomonas subterranea TaxID=2847989 RepID=A0ABX8LM47_9BACT|nr:recombinase family protein [Geomonas subterranea]QXE92554.1 recombinase family protein [Geomonas subterranea]QXM09348.1 recombinase family protein [Geomonas subterranea]